MFGRTRVYQAAPAAQATPVASGDPYATQTVAVPQSHGRALAGATAAGVGAGFHIIARAVMLVGALIVALIVLAIVLRDVGANPHNSIVKGLHDGANFFAGSFTGLVSETDHPKRAITIDWGIAAVVYLLVAGLVASLVNRMGRGATSLDSRTVPPTVAPTV